MVESLKLLPETIAILLPLVPAFLALSSRQRLAVLNRDNKKCNLPAEHDCGGKLHAHHILPQGYCKLLEIQPDYPENVITICENAHVRTLDSIHPDMAIALANYHIDPKAIERVKEQRESLMEQREIYWNPKWDRVLSAIAVRNTQRAKIKGWQWPEKNGEKK